MFPWSTSVLFGTSDTHAFSLKPFRGISLISVKPQFAGFLTGQSFDFVSFSNQLNWTKIYFCDLRFHNCLLEPLNISDPKPLCPLSELYRTRSNGMIGFCLNRFSAVVFLLLRKETSAVSNSMQRTIPLSSANK